MYRYYIKILQCTFSSILFYTTFINTENIYASQSGHFNFQNLNIDIKKPNQQFRMHSGISPAERLQANEGKEQEEILINKIKHFDSDSFKAQALANQLTFRAVNNIGCSDFEEYFMDQLYPRLVSLRNRNFSPDFLKNMVWDYSYTRYKEHNNHYHITQTSLVELFNDYLSTGQLNVIALKSFNNFSATAGIPCPTNLARTRPTDNDYLPNGPLPASTPSAEESAPTASTPEVHNPSSDQQSSHDTASTEPSEPGGASTPATSSSHDSPAPSPAPASTESEHSHNDSNPQVESESAARPIQPQPPSSRINTSSQDAIIKSVVEHVRNTEPSCSVVSTGNKGGTERAEPYWTYVMARSFVSDICTPRTPRLYQEQSKDIRWNSPLPSLTKGQSKSHFRNHGDAMQLSHFQSRQNEFRSFGQDGNIAATYALLYAQGRRESGGDFTRGKDANTNNNSLLTRETGAYQVSSNTLDGSQTPGAQELFKAFAQDIKNNLHNPQALSQICGIQDFGDSPRKRKNGSQAQFISHLQHLFSQNKQPNYAPANRAEMNSCSTMLNESRSSSGLPPTNSRGLCFIGFHKACPAFSIKYNSIVVRNLRNHYGPLVTSQEHKAMGRYQRYYHKPYPVPACGSLFVNLLQQKNALCGTSSSQK